VEVTIVGVEESLCSSACASDSLTLYGSVIGKLVGQFVSLHRSVIGKLVGQFVAF